MARRNYHKGQNAGNFLNEKVLNDLESRLQRLENMIAIPPLELIKHRRLIALGLKQTSGEDLFVRLIERLDPYCSTQAQPLKLSQTIPSSSSSSECDVPLQLDTDKDPITVIEIDGVTSLAETNGKVFKIKGDNDVWVFIPWPLAQGDNKPNYNFTRFQLLGHRANGYLQWIDTDTTCDTATSSSG